MADKLPLFDGEQAYGALCILDYLLALFTAAGRESFTRDVILVTLNSVKNDPELFALDTVLDYEKTVEGDSDG